MRPTVINCYQVWRRHAPHRYQLLPGSMPADALAVASCFDFAFDPTFYPVRCEQGDLGTIDKWWAQWFKFIFETSVTVKGKKGVETNAIKGYLAREVGGMGRPRPRRHRGGIGGRRVLMTARVHVAPSWRSGC